MFKELLEIGVGGKTYTEEEAKQLMDTIMDGEATPSQIASLLTLLRFRGETVDELTGFTASMREHVKKLPVRFDGLVDTCGTGGDGKSTFNISTASAIVMSALGTKVAKHGNRGFTSKSGSADVLEKLGIPIQTTPEAAVESIETNNMCFLFAPLYHVAMKHAVLPRQEIGFRTFFNILGPLSNPAGSDRQLIGVYDFSLAKKMAETLKRLGTKRALLVTGGDGLDECSIATHTNIIELSDGQIKEYAITPEEVGLKRGVLKDVQVNSSHESADLIRRIFIGKGSESAEGIVAMNAGAGLYVAGKAPSIKAGVEMVRNAVHSDIVQSHYLELIQEKGAEHYA